VDTARRICEQPSNASTLWGAGRVEDTFNLIGRAALHVVRSAAQRLGKPVERVALEAGVPVRTTPSPAGVRVLHGPLDVSVEHEPQAVGHADSEPARAVRQVLGDRRRGALARDEAARHRHRARRKAKLKAILESENPAAFEAGAPETFEQAAQRVHESRVTAGIGATGDPTTFLVRLAALVPPPRHPLVRSTASSPRTHPGARRWYRQRLRRRRAARPAARVTDASDGRKLSVVLGEKQPELERDAKNPLAAAGSKKAVRVDAARKIRAMLTTPMFPTLSPARSNGAQLHHEPQRLDRALRVRKFSSHIVGQHANVRRRGCPPSDQLVAPSNSDPSSVGVGATVLELVFFTHRLRTPHARAAWAVEH